LTNGRTEHSAISIYILQTQSLKIHWTNLQFFVFLSNLHDIFQIIPTRFRHFK